MRVLITGGTGSLGQNISRWLLRENAEICIYSRHEDLQVEMQRKFPDCNMRFFIGDVRDFKRLKRAMSGVDCVIHCAALKHVSVCEFNPIEAVQTNVLGAVNVIDCAIDEGVKKVINISSDKAVHPINIYGATKLVAEKLFIYSNVYTKGKTLFSCVRFGNIEGSRGSVISLWKNQRKLGKIFITEKEMVRYWITPEEASVFVLERIKDMKGGEIFIPIMPQQTMIDLAKKIAPECEIEVIGKRKGEKLSELLLNEEEENRVIKKEGYMMLKEEF